MKVILILSIIFIVLKCISAECETPSFKYFVQLQSNKSGRYLQSSDLNGNAAYKWDPNSINNKICTFPPLKVNDRLGYFFFDVNATGLLYNDYYQLSINVSSFSSLSNNSDIVLRLQNGSFVNENSDYYVSFDSLYNTSWKISFLSVPSLYSSQIQDKLFKPIKIYYATNPYYLFDVSGTTNYTINFNGNNKRIALKQLSNNTSTFNTTFTLIPVQNGKVAIKDSYGNYLSSDPTDRRAFTVQHLGDWEKMNLVNSGYNTFKIQSLYGSFTVNSSYVLSLSYNESISSSFYFELQNNCLPTPTPNVTVSPTPSVTPNVTVSPTPSVTPNVTVSPTPSVTPNVTVSPTPSVTPNVTVSPTPSVTPNVTTTPTPTQSPSLITCTNNNNLLTINSNELIECIGNGSTFCEDSYENSCSTDSNYSNVKCTTKAGYMQCKGNHITCKSSYLTCTIDINLSNSMIVEDSSNNY